MKSLILSIFVATVSTNVYAVDFDKYIKLMKTEINRLMGNEDESRADEFPMPALPAILQDALSTDVYKKEGEIYTQGKDFQKLSNEQKRKYRVAFLSELYKVVRGAEIRTAELSTGVNILEQGGTREGIYRSLVLGNEYRTLETYEESPSEDLLVWSLAYAKKFLGLSFQKDQVAKLNLWGIKRVLVGKTLDLMDSFPSDGKDLYQWYAHLSVTLSKQKKIEWKNKVRKNQNLKYHFLWAQKVPLQQIKSEVIIKLNRVFNSLM